MNELKFVMSDLDLALLHEYASRLQSGGKTSQEIAEAEGEPQVYRIEKQMYWGLPLGLFERRQKPMSPWLLTPLGGAFVRIYRTQRRAKLAILECIYYNASCNDALMRSIVHGILYPRFASGFQKTSVSEIREWVIENSHIYRSKDEATLHRQVSIRLAALTTRGLGTDRECLAPLGVVERDGADIVTVTRMPDPLSAAYILSTWWTRTWKLDAGVRAPIDALLEEGGPARAFFLRRREVDALLDTLYSQRVALVERVGGLDQFAISIDRGLESSIKLLESLV